MIMIAKSLSIIDLLKIKSWLLSLEQDDYDNSCIGEAS